MFDQQTNNAFNLFATLNVLLLMCIAPPSCSRFGVYVSSMFRCTGMVSSPPQLRLPRWLLQIYLRWIVWVHVPANTQDFEKQQPFFFFYQSLRMIEREGAYACLIISSTGVWAAWRGSTRGASAACCICLLYCLTDDIRFKKRGTNVPQPPSLNKILKLCVEYSALCSFSGTTCKFLLHTQRDV